jgi:20S proteasome subunit alpha 5
MFLTRNEYDRGVNTFSPEGRLFQVEYAIEAIKLGSTAIGIATSEGVVLACEKRITSTLLEPSSIEKIAEVDAHMGCAMSGLTADALMIIEHARVDTQYHRFTYDEPMRIETATQSICDLALRFGESEDDDEGDEQGMSRPFGVALLIAGWDVHAGAQLFHADPSGTYIRYDAKAIGAASEAAQTSLQEQYHRSMTLVEAETLALQILKQVMEEKLDAENCELASVSATSGKFVVYSREQVQAVLNRLA